MKTLLRVNITVLLVLCLTQARSQEGLVNFDRVVGTKEVSVGKIAGITQDKFGYMWFTDQSNRCVIRYDGYRMKTYRNIIGDSNSITSPIFEAIAADTNGNVWIGNVNGVDKLNVGQNKVAHYYFPSGRKSGYVLSLLLDHLGILWIGTPEGLYSLEEKTGKFTRYANNPEDSASLSCDVVYKIYEDRQGVLWIATGSPWGSRHFFNSSCGGLNKFNRQKGTFTQYKHDPHNPQSLINNQVRAILEDSKGNFWIGTQGDGLHIMNRRNGTFERLTYDPSNPKKLSRPPMKLQIIDHIPFIIEDAAGAIWIGTYLQGLTRYDPGIKEITRFKSETRPNGFSDSTTWCAYRSRDGMLWISTEEGSLFRIDPLASKFSYIRLKDFTWSFFEDPPGTLWMGKRNNGLIKLDRRNANSPTVSNYFIARGRNIGVNGICRADSGKYWVATFSGLYQFDPKSAVFVKSSIIDKKHNKDLKAISVVNDLTNNDLYITGIGFHVLNTRTNTLTDFWHDRRDTTSISGDTLIVAVQDHLGNFWIGTKDAGINYFDKSKKKFIHFLSDLTVYAAFVDATQTVWAGTERGLFKKEKSADLFSQALPSTNDLANTPITALTGDNQGNVWAVWSAGIFRINAYKKEFAIYGKKFGISDIDWSTKSDAIQASDGKIFLGSSNGYYSFYPKDVINNVTPNIILTGFKIDGRSVNLDNNGPLNTPIEEIQQIILNHNQNIFSIDFAAIHFSDPENNIHQYMLEGYENAWRDVGVEKTAYYFNIPPGHYTFRIKANTSYGTNSAKSVKIIVLPPWWQTWWAYCLYGLLAICTVWAFTSWRTGMLKKENVLLEEKVAVRTRELLTTQSQLIAEKEAKLIADFNQKFSESELKALRAQMNPHFVFNILNTIESYALDNNKEAASLMIQKFSRLTRMVLENSMNQMVPIKNDLKALQLYIELEQMRYANKFFVKYNIDREMLEEDYFIPPMIIQPFVENAILHGLRNKPNNNGVLNVSARLHDSYIVVAVEDNGIGRTKSAQLKINNPIQKKSIGINVTQDRIAIFNNLNQTRKAKIDIHDLAEGTRVIIQLPIAL
jgi:ligand-binding sensor domain-containing protein